MNKHLEQKFQQIAEDLLAETGNVDCSPEEYREGLHMIIDDLKMAISASEEVDG
jgi:hypothetical protein